MAENCCLLLDARPMRAMRVNQNELKVAKTLHRSEGKYRVITPPFTLHTVSLANC